MYKSSWGAVIVCALVMSCAAYAQEADQAEFDAAYERIRDGHLLFERSCEELRVQGYIKLIKRVRDEIAALMRRLHEYDMEPFFVYKSETINSAVFIERIEKQLVPALAFCEEIRAKDEQSDKLKRLNSLLSELYEHVLLFYQDSVRAALEQSADVKKLQKLLELV